MELDLNTLPRDLVLKILARLGSPQDILLCSTLSHFFAEIANEPELWHELATNKYGENVAEATIRLYYEDWKEMMKDDNRLGALPTSLCHKPCRWKHNDERRFYCCIITALQWDREVGGLRVYFDVRGEPDLRHPLRSSICIRSTDGNTVETFRPVTWEEDASNTVGHYKGYLVFPQGRFEKDGVYNFCYANLIHGGADYESIPILNGKLNKSLFDHYTLNEFLFENETSESELNRWKQVLPNNFLQRRPDWWV